EHGMAGGPSSFPLPSLGFAEGDYYVPKRRYSAFFQTGLRLLLDELGTSTLLVCGFDTNICVRHTLADAFFNNYDSVVVSDATATFLVGTQEDGLNQIKVCYGSLVSTTGEVVAFLEHAAE
ncbi:MAG: cysteine hydrolase, partial [Eggerthellaceae bacterium]|nr:cysteine hydrolase [Eggerthellaceae bacterium]